MNYEEILVSGMTADDIQKAKEVLKRNAVPVVECNVCRAQSYVGPCPNGPNCLNTVVVPNVLRYLKSEQRRTDDPEMADCNARDAIKYLLASLGLHEIVTEWNKVPRL